MVVGRAKAASRYVLDSPAAIGSATDAARSPARSDEISMGPLCVENFGSASNSSAAGVGNATTRLSRYRSPCNSDAGGLKLRLTPRKGPVAAGGCARIRARDFPPETRLSLHTYFFMAASRAPPDPPVPPPPGH